MLQNRATLKESRYHLLNELRKQYTEHEASSITRLILDHAGLSLSQCLMEPDKITPSGIITQINGILREIRRGRPIQYILGQVQFFSLELIVNESVLIPRPETEEMVHHILSGERQAWDRIMDLGTGSGCLALALKKEHPEAAVYGMDLSREALDVARENGRLNGLDVHWVEGDIFQAGEWAGRGDFSQGFDLVVSNPPYVLDSEKALMEDHVLHHEPGRALFVRDQDPLIYYRAILNFCRQYLRNGGQLWMEINERFGEELAQMCREEGMNPVRIMKDIHEKLRYIYALKQNHGI